jgi:hypothetical protein
VTSAVLFVALADTAIVATVVLAVLLEGLRNRD